MRKSGSSDLRKCSARLNERKTGLRNTLRHSGTFRGNIAVPLIRGSEIRFANPVWCSVDRHCDTHKLAEGAATLRWGKGGRWVGKGGMRVGKGGMRVGKGGSSTGRGKVTDTTCATEPKPSSPQGEGRTRVSELTGQSP